MYNKNNKGSKMIPWGTPLVTNVLPDLQPFITQYTTTKVCPEPVSFGAGYTVTVNPFFIVVRYGQPY